MRIQIHCASGMVGHMLFAELLRRGLDVWGCAHVHSITGQNGADGSAKSRLSPGPQTQGWPQVWPGCAD